MRFRARANERPAFAAAGIRAEKGGESPMDDRSVRSKRRTVASAALGLSLLLGAASQARAETLYVRSEDATLRSAADAGASEVGPVARGTELTVVSRDGSWIQVQAGGKSGWIHKLKTAADKPDTGGGALASLGGGSRDSYVKEAESGRAARGLSPMAEKYAQNKALSPESIAAVKRMEQVVISKKEIEGFLKEGKLGEYAP